MGGVVGSEARDSVLLQRARWRIAVPDFFWVRSKEVVKREPETRAARREMLELCKRDLRLACQAQGAVPRRLGELSRSERVRAALAG